MICFKAYEYFKQFLGGDNLGVQSSSVNTPVFFVKKDIQAYSKFLMEISWNITHLKTT